MDKEEQKIYDDGDNEVKQEYEQGQENIIREK